VVPYGDAKAARQKGILAMGCLFIQRRFFMSACDEAMFEVKERSCSKSGAGCRFVAGSVAAAGARWLFRKSGAFAQGTRSISARSRNAFDAKDWTSFHQHKV